MSQSGEDHSIDTAEEGYDMEFRLYADDAWYSVRLLLEGEIGDKLRVKYDSFPDDQDNVFLADGFKSEDELCDFVGRFRKVSAQLQDPDCSTVVKGMRVCASDTFDSDDIRFYDAVVDDVLHKKHSNLNGQEECECTFLLFWLHGPNVGNVTDKGVANICLLQDSELHPKLASFMEIAMQKIVKASCEFVSGTSNDLVCNLIAQHKENNSSPIVEQKRSFAGSLGQVTSFACDLLEFLFPKPHSCREITDAMSANLQGKCAQRSLSKVWPSEGGNCVNRQDTDVGGDKKLYAILVQNLEKEMSSSTVSKFIHEQTSIATQVYILPSLPWEPYTNGVIMLDCKKDLVQLFGFLQSPNHFIVSSNGRPLVATEKSSMNDHWTLMLKSPNKLLNRRGAGFSKELKVVCSGTEEYKKANELRDLFLQFIDHQKRLYKKLCAEERSIS